MWVLSLTSLLLFRLLISAVAQDTSFSSTTIALTDTTTSTYCPKCSAIIETISVTSSSTSSSTTTEFSSAITTTTTTGWTGSFTTTYSTETSVITDSLESTTPEIIIHVELPSKSTVQKTHSNSANSTLQISITSPGRTSCSCVTSNGTNTSTSQIFTTSIQNSSKRSIISSTVTQNSVSSNFVTTTHINTVSSSDNSITSILQNTSTEQLKLTTLSNVGSQTTKTYSSEQMSRTTTNSKITTTLSIITINSSHSFNVSNKITYNSIPSISVVKDSSPISDNVSTIHFSTPTSNITNHVTSITVPVNDKESSTNVSTNNSSSKTNNIPVSTIYVSTTNTPLTVQNSVYLSKTIPSQSKSATPVSSSSFMTIQTYKGIANNRVFNIQNSLVAFIMILLV